MNLQAVFGKRKVFLPVIHTLTDAQVIENVRVAVENGADGVFVIDQKMHSVDLLGLIPRIRVEVPELRWLGVNILSWFPDATLNQLPSLGVTIDGLWSDSSGIGEDQNDGWIDRVVRARANLGWKGLWFGGIAFKYRTPILNSRIHGLVQNAESVDVVTTTGHQTGTPAEMSKVETFRAALGERPLALASGITVENISRYLPKVDAFLVATGIERSFGKLDAKRVRAMADAVAAFNTM